MCMARQSAAARKKSRASARARSQSRKFSLMNGLEAIIIGSAITQGAFKMSLVPWVSEGWLTARTSASDNSNELSASEIVRGLVPGGGGHGMSGAYAEQGMGRTIMDNVRAGLPVMLGTLIIAPIGFRMIKKLARRPIGMFNKLLSNTGAPIKV